MTNDLINRLGTFVHYPHIEGVNERAGGIFLSPSMNYSGVVPSTEYAYDIGDGRAMVVRQVSQKPELGVRHSMLLEAPLSIVGGGSDNVQALISNLTSDEAKRIIHALEVNPSLLQSLTDVPFDSNYVRGDLGRSGFLYNQVKDPEGNLRNWLGRLWDAQKKVNANELRPVLFPHIKEHRKNVKQELFTALNKRVHKSNALMAAGMGLAGALAGDEDSKLKTSVLGALGAGLGTYGSAFASQFASSDKLQNKLYRMLVRRPWLRMGAGALGGLAGILAGKGTSGSDEGSVIDELADSVADKVEDLTGSDVKGSDMLKYILLCGGGLAALGGLGYAATRKKKKKSKEKRDA